MFAARQDQYFDLKRVRSPIIVFASMGDNITPPQQAFNWICDVYGSTEEVKANGQVIVGLMHGDVGHLGIFVSGKVAKKEHTQIVEVLRYVETLAPGLYAMKIDEARGADGKLEYTVSLTERRLEDLRGLQRFDRKDEKVFDAVAAVSEFNERAYELLRPAAGAGAGERDDGALAARLSSAARQPLVVVGSQPHDLVAAGRGRGGALGPPADRCGEPLAGRGEGRLGAPERLARLLP